MKDHYDHTVDPRDLTKRLNRIQKSHSTPNDGDYISRLPRLSRTGTSSSDTPSFISRLPTFRKSATMSTTASDDTCASRLEASSLRSGPSSRECRASAEVGRGDFSKPRAGTTRRRQNSESAKSVPEFQYYGRHANTWLFNDFSITDSVRKGWGKVFSGKGD